MCWCVCVCVYGVAVCVSLCRLESGQKQAESRVLGLLHNLRLTTSLQILTT